MSDYVIRYLWDDHLGVSWRCLGSWSQRGLYPPHICNEQPLELIPRSPRVEFNTPQGHAEVIRRRWAMRRECRERMRCGLFASWLRVWLGEEEQDDNVKCSWEGNQHLHQVWPWDLGEDIFVLRDELLGFGLGLRGSGEDTDFSLVCLYLWFEEDHQFVEQSDFTCLLWGCMNSADFGTHCTIVNLLSRVISRAISGAV